MAKEKEKHINKNLEFEGSGYKEKELKEKSVYVKVSDDIRNRIDKYKDTGKTISNIIETAIEIYDNYFSMPLEVHTILDNYEGKHGNKFKVIEEAIKFFDKHTEPEKSNNRDLWNRARDEMNMMLIGKTTFNQLITSFKSPKNKFDHPFKRNIAFDIILWYTRKPIKSLSLEEILYAIQKIWNVANYFYMIDLKKINENQYRLVFKHH